MRPAATPPTLGLTAGIFVAFDGAQADTPARAISGTIDDVAEALAGYREQGVSHVIAHVFPRTVDAVRQLGEAAGRARERLSPAAAASG